MRRAPRLVAALVLVCLMMNSVPSFATLTMSGTLTGGQTLLIIQPNNSTNAATGVLKFKFSAPTAGAYSLGFCIGPVANPCGSAAYFVSVQGGHTQLAVVNASIFNGNELVIENPTSSSVGYSVSME